MILLAMTLLPAARNTAGIKTIYAAAACVCLAGSGGLTAERGWSEQG